MRTEVKNNDKVLIIIPAYNEEENIVKVIQELQKDIPKNFDILIINDCSTDNTEEVLKQNRIHYINNIFNMKYALTIQTGIKYALENDYDYVIHMDADGQHIPKETIKLYNTIKKDNCDIVIGSRYIRDLGYPCPFFRRLGTKIFVLLIKLFTGKKIADPLSGFQCLNKRVITEYSKKGAYPEFPDANLVIEMLFKGYKIEEIPVKMRLRENGESMHGGIIKPIRYMIQMFYAIVLIVIQNVGKKRVR